MNTYLCQKGVRKENKMAKYSLYEIIKPKLGYKARKKIEDIIEYNELVKEQKKWEMKKQTSK